MEVGWFTDPDQSKPITILSRLATILFLPDLLNAISYILVRLVRLVRLIGSFGLVVIFCPISFYFEATSYILLLVRTPNTLLVGF